MLPSPAPPASSYTVSNLHRFQPHQHQHPTPLTHQVLAILVLDSEGARIASKFYSRADFPDKLAQVEFERKIFKKTRSAAGARAESEVALSDGLAVVFRSSSDVTFYVVGAPDENELFLIMVLDALYDAVSALVKAPIDRRVLHTNLELLLLAIDEMVDGGVCLEVDPLLIESRVMLRGAVPDSVSSYREMTVGTVISKAQDRVVKSFAKN